MLFDDILTEIGEFGPCQIIFYCMYGLIFLATAWQNMGITFIGGAMDHWCQVAALSELTYVQQRDVAIPYEDGSTEEYQQCRMFALNYSAYSEDELLNWNRSLMVDENTTTTSCQSWIYDQSIFTSTIVSQWDLVCGKSALVSLVQTMYFTGYLLGAAVYGQLSDRFGRRKILIFTLVTWVLFGVISAVMPNYAAYVFFRFLLGSSVSGAYIVAFVICMEIIGPRFRTVTGICVQMWFAVGLMVIAGIAYAIPNHITLQLVLSSCVVVTWFAAWIIPESPRWLVTVGRDDEAEKILEKIANFNSRSLPANLGLSDNRPKGTESTEKGATVWCLMKYPSMRIIGLNMWFTWFACSLGYYGLSLGVSILGGSIYVNTVISGAVEIPSYIMSIFLIRYVGRRWPTVLTIIAMSVACFICSGLITDEDLTTSLTIFLMMGKFFSAATFAIVYVYSAEVFPTDVRNVGVGASSMCARVGSLIQPQIANLDSVWPPAQFFVYGFFGLIGGVCAFFLPETRNQKLPETLEEAEEWIKSKKKKKHVDKIYPEISEGAVNQGVELGEITDQPEKNETPSPGD